MKKLIIFLMTIIGANIFFMNSVSAKTYYEGDYIQGIWMTKEKNGTKLYQKARFFNEKYTNNFAYCTEPFAMFNENSTYVESNVAYSLTNDVIERLKLIAYFGYGYGNHTDVKWYAITQFMIWQAADPSGDYYFTDSLNGNRITIFTDEINEINNLINNYKTLPSISNANIKLIEGKSITLNDSNGVLHNYTSSDSRASINGDSITISALNQGKYYFNLTRSENKYNHIPIFSHADSSQDMLLVGDIDSLNTKISVEVKQTKIELTKIDSETKTTTPQGDASLIGSVYMVYDSNMNEVGTITIGDESKGSIINLDEGTYFLKEIKAGEGYKINETMYEAIISFDDNIKKLTVEDEVIKKKIIIHKTKGDGISSSNEKNVSFDIYNKNNEIVDTIITDDYGYASIILPYGNYIFKQLNSTDGYMKVDDFNVEIVDEIEREIHLYDHKIKNDKNEIKTIKHENYDYIISVPNTGSNRVFLGFYILLFFGSIYVKKRIIH